MSGLLYLRKKHKLGIRTMETKTKISRGNLSRMDSGQLRVSRQRINAVLSILKDNDNIPYLLEGYLPPLAWEIAKKRPLEFNKKLQSLCKAIIKAK